MIACFFLKAVVHHSPNEFGMSGREVARQVSKHKRMEMLPGFPDFIVLRKTGLQCRTVGLEVKAEGNGQTAAQKDAEIAFKLKINLEEISPWEVEIKRKSKNHEATLEFKK